MNNVLDLLHCCLVVESRLEGGWQELYEKWIKGEYSYEKFKEGYISFCNDYFEAYLDQFASFIQ
jgi:hypothetical protein